MPVRVDSRPAGLLLSLFPLVAFVFLLAVPRGPPAFLFALTLMTLVFLFALTLVALSPFSISLHM